MLESTGDEMKAFLILEDGTVFEGTQIGADREIISEIVFNTSMAGYLEVLTDPSYAGQAVCMTYPLIGNYGICKDDMESKKPWPDGFIVRELSRNFSNFRADLSIQQFLQENDVPGIAGIDTRALTKILREKGTMNGMITTNEQYRLDDVLPGLKAYTTGRVVEKVTCKEKYEVKGAGDLSENGALSGSAKFVAADYEAGVREGRPSLVRALNGAGRRVALLDLGTKDNIACSLKMRGCDVTVYPASTPASEIIASRPDGIMLERAWRSEGVHRDHCGDQKTLRHGHSDLCDLSRAPAHGARDGGRYLQDEVRAPRRQPPGEGSRHRAGLYLLAESRLRGRHGKAGSQGCNARLCQRQ